MFLQRCNDVLSSGIILELFPLAIPPYKFDIKKFYADAISFDEDEIASFSSDTYVASRIEDLNSRIRHKEYRKRVQASLLLHLTPKMSIAVSAFNTIHKATKLTPMFVDAKTNKPLKTLTKLVCAETGAILYENQIGLYIPFGSKKIVFSKEEIKKHQNILHSRAKNYGI